MLVLSTTTGFRAAAESTSACCCFSRPLQTTINARRHNVDLSFDHTDDAALAPKAAVIDHHFDWEDDKAPKVAYHNSIIYETHVKSLTWLMPGLPDEIRGTYSALAHPVLIDHLKKLGITAIELMPVQQSITERQLEEKGLTNYWGYHTIGFFSPDIRFYNGKDIGGPRRLQPHRPGVL